ncbi:tRNA-binding protein [Kroppenstedtia guangzhouensis]|jgi:tRNA-binding protein|uniref:tRNA-binding protein n=1 Tax=Kroppenstedtia guangzhouensis TaxID=1274356 RepID=A0ABQ1FZH3_9BACL|nr:tRNA-binding protein [Kroppenstedtia guangzhouensis]GGA33417.1 tRNA-binding protein [Kroppenstedtia guangzhouensis]
MAQIHFDDFLKVEIRTGKILRAEAFPKARKPAYKLWIDFGEELGVKKSSAQITKLYTLEGLAGMRVLAVTNFPPLQVADFMSEVLVLGVETGEGEVALIQADREVPLGKRIS